MADIHIQRMHRLGLPKARQVALAWAEDAEKKFDMACTVVPGDTSDTLEFKRSGVTGSLLVEADRFEINAKLGLLMGAFSKTIEAEITKNLDALLGGSGSVSGAVSHVDAPISNSAKAAQKATKKASK